jgi:5-hydroxyisourate hydrolase
MSVITTHVLDLAAGIPAAGVRVVLESRGPGGGWTMMAERVTDPDGRVREFIAPGTALRAGAYRLTFDAGRYFAALGVETFFSEIAVQFEIRDVARPHHVPLLLSPFGYSTYRGT